MEKIKVYQLKPFDKFIHRGRKYLYITHDRGEHHAIDMITKAGYIFGFNTNVERFE